MRQTQQRILLSIGLFLVWFLFVSVALYQMSFADYGEFDPSYKWHGLRVTLDRDKLQLPKQQDWQLVHVLPKHCRCSALAEQHRKDISVELSLTDDQQFYRTVEQVEAAGLQLPAVPAVLVFNAGKLVYAGPYASGPRCSTTHSFLPALIRGNVQLPATWLNGETKACRCVITHI